VRKNSELKAFIVTIEKASFIFGAPKGKVAWDD
jgi:hypothetical protein